jgi:hypothetical protein
MYVQSSITSSFSKGRNSEVRVCDSGAFPAHLMLVYTLLRDKFSTFGNNSLSIQDNSENHMSCFFQVLVINSKF